MDLALQAAQLPRAADAIHKRWLKNNNRHSRRMMLNSMSC